VHWVCMQIRLMDKQQNALPEIYTPLVYSKLERGSASALGWSSLCVPPFLSLLNWCFFLSSIMSLLTSLSINLHDNMMRMEQLKILIINIKV